jgi:hypothetical protein
MKLAVVFSLIAALWIGVGYTNYHETLGSFTAMFPAQNHVGVAVRMAIGGPFALPAVWLNNDPHVWLDKPYTCMHRWTISFQDGHAKDPDLDETFLKDTFLTYEGSDCQGQI